MPRSVPLLALSALALAACSSASNGEPLADGEPGRLVRFEGLLSTISSCHGDEREELVARDAASFEAWWDRAACDGRPLPAVDFEREMVLAAGGSEGPNGCYRVRIAEVRSDVGGGYLVVVARHVPEASRPCPMVVVHPAAAVRVPAVRGPVRFEWRTTTEPPPASEVR